MKNNTFKEQPKKVENYSKANLLFDMYHKVPMSLGPILYETYKPMQHNNHKWNDALIDSNNTAWNIITQDTNFMRAIIKKYDNRLKKKDISRLPLYP